MRISPAIVRCLSQGPRRLWQKKYVPPNFVFLASAGLMYAWFSYQLLRTVGNIAIGPDAWSLIDVARSIQNGTFPQIQAVRQFKMIDHMFVNTAFPPLTPLLLALHGSEGAWAFAIVRQSILIALALPVPLFFALKRIFNPIESTFTVLLTTVAVLSYAPYREDVVINGTMSLSVFLLCSAFAVLLSRQTGLKEAATLGLLMGLNCLNRTDGLPLAGVMLVGVFCVSGFRLRTALIYFGTFLVTMSPWIAFSKLYFGVFLISDNLTVAWAISDHILQIH